MRIARRMRGCIAIAAVAGATICLLSCGSDSVSKTQVTDGAHDGGGGHGGSGGTSSSGGRDAGASAGGTVMTSAGGAVMTSAGGAIGASGDAASATGGSSGLSEGGSCSDSCDPGAASACDGTNQVACLAGSDGCRRMAPCGARICATGGQCANVVIRQWGGSRGNYASGVAFDASGDVYVAAGTTGGLPTIGTFVGTVDAALIKWTSTGSLIWALDWGTTGWDSGYDVAVDNANRPYTVGYVEGDLYGAPRFEINPQYPDVGMIRTSGAGEVQWSTEWGSDAEDIPVVMAHDPNDDIYVAGTTKGSFDGFTALGQEDVFLTKWSKDKKVWSQRLGTSALDAPSAIALDAAGNVYVSGWTQGAFPGMTAGGVYDAFLAKWSRDGKLAWVTQWGGADIETGADVAIFGDRIYVVGNIDYTVPPLTAPDTDGYIALFDPTGKQQWRKPWGGSLRQAAESMALDAAGNVLVCGYIEDDPASGKPTLATDLILWKFDPNGQEQWHITWGSTSYDHCARIVMGPSGILGAVGTAQGQFGGPLNTAATDGGPWLGLIRLD